MIEPGTPYNFPIKLMGPVARRTVGRLDEGRVAAVFERSFYIEWGNSFVCIGVPDLAPGPLTASAGVPSGMNWMSSGLRVDARAVGADGVVTVDGRFRFDARCAADWSPPAFPGRELIVSPPDSVLSTIRALAPKNGLAPLVFQGGTTVAISPVVIAAQPAHRRLTDWVRLVSGDVDVFPPAQSVCQLLGLGPGLTPSGDDYLGGMMIALRAFGYGRAVKRLYAIIRREAPRRTNRMSAAHLAAAWEGWGAAPLHDVLNRLTANTGASLSSVISEVGRIGHTSGWDALTGLLAVVQARSSSASCGGSRAA